MTSLKPWGIATLAGLALLVAAGLWFEQHGAYRRAILELDTCSREGKRILELLDPKTSAELESNLRNSELDMGRLRQIMMETLDPDLLLEELEDKGRNANVQIKKIAWDAHRSKPTQRGDVSVVLFGSRGDIDAFIRKIYLWRRVLRWREDRVLGTGVAGVLTFYAHATPKAPPPVGPCPPGAVTPWLPPYRARIERRRGAVADSWSRIAAAGGLRDRVVRYDELSYQIQVLVDAINACRQDQKKDPLCPRENAATEDAKPSASPRSERVTEVR